MGQWIRHYSHYPLNGKEVRINRKRHSDDHNQSRECGGDLCQQGVHHCKIWQVKAYGLEEITSDVWEVDSQELSKILQVQPHLLVRPVGKVDMLIGSDCCQLLPRVVKTVDNLQLLENQFGYCVRGSIEYGERQSCNNVCITLNHVTVGVEDFDIDVSEVPS